VKNLIFSLVAFMAAGGAQGQTFRGAINGTVTDPSGAVVKNAAGDLGRNALYGPGFADTDMSVFKNTPLKERLRVQLRAEMFNVFKRKNMASGGG